MTDEHVYDIPNTILAIFSCRHSIVSPQRIPVYMSYISSNKQHPKCIKELIGHKTCKWFNHSIASHLQYILHQWYIVQCIFLPWELYFSSIYRYEKFNLFYLPLTIKEWNGTLFISTKVEYSLFNGCFHGSPSICMNAFFQWPPLISNRIADALGNKRKEDKSRECQIC